MGTVGSLHHAVGHHAVDAQALDRSLLQEVVRGDEALAGQEPTAGGHAEQVVEIGVGPEELPVPTCVGAVHVHERHVE